MKKQLNWEDVNVGDDVPVLEKVATSQMLAMWAGAVGDFNPLHFEFQFAEKNGMANPIVHGQLKRAWLVQMMTNWIGDAGTLKQLSCQFRGVDFPVMMKTLTEPLSTEVTQRCKGTVTAKGEENGERFVSCKIWVENAEGVETTTGSAKVILP